MKKYLLQFFLVNVALFLIWIAWHFHLLSLFLGAKLADAKLLLPHVIVLWVTGLQWLIILVVTIVKGFKKAWGQLLLNVLLLLGCSIICYAAIAFYILIVDLAFW